MNKDRRIAPYRASLDDLCRITRDNFDAGEFWIITDSVEVTIAHQIAGEEAKAMVTIPRREFNRLIRWYMRPQKVVRVLP